MSKQWQFIFGSASGNGKLDDAMSRKQVRQTAMREYRRNQRAARAAEYQRQKDACTIQIRKHAIDPDQRQSLALDTHCGQVLALRAPSSIFDPFSSTALPKTRDAAYLLSYCKILLPYMPISDFGRQRREIYYSPHASCIICWCVPKLTCT
jgi:hypothetical protein